MAIDFTSLVGGAESLRVAHATFRPGDDGVELGRHNLRGDPLPGGALLLGVAQGCTADFTFDGSGTVTLQMGDVVLPTVPLTYPSMITDWTLGLYILVSGTPRPLSLVVAGAPLLSGLLNVWLIYLPNASVAD